ncbi:DEAD/DEAH box helicase [Shewanella sp. Isolate11]|uniref:DEAD/DEAH box helicase n=1 Tax=Shewanella sp. Isolate11 TaxID=2908530 RepID=UPI001EFE6189|nr:DEAD/DEAH box helicase [Shewanella sp. Isolate11]MCG9697315.1 DEAD/DEAH box helicase [Shewanella sp. Isolate11]
MLFTQLGLTPQLLEALNQLNFSEPTPVQHAAIPVILAGEDLLASAQTGTGKTAAFGLPILQHLLSKTDDNGPDQAVKALILVPTRELALQVQTNIQALAQNTSLKTGVVYGGVSIEAQQNKLQQGVDLLVATPGRLLDHLNRQSVSLDKVAYLVFDEADRMLDMGFMDEINALLAQLPSQRQTLLFSATLDDNVMLLSRGLLRAPKRVEVDQNHSAAKDVEQQVYAVDSEKKFALLCHLVSKGNWQRVLVFSRKKVAVDKLVQRLNDADISASAFHGDLAQGQREQVLTGFKSGDIRVLVATDVAARGIDIQSLDYVVNYELPYVAQDYVHRIGRTGRAGNKGLAITLFSEEDALLLEEVEVLLDKRLPQQWLLGLEPDLTKADPFAGRNNKAAQKRRAKKRGYRGKK